MEHFFFTRGVSLAWLLRHPHVGRGEQKAMFETALCRHAGPCRVNALRGVAKGMVVGYGITATVALFKLISNKRKRRAAKRVVMKAICNRDSLRLSVFLGTFVGTLKATNCVLRWTRGKEDGANAILAAGLAGCTILLLPKGGGRADLSLYTFSRALDVVVHLITATVPGRGQFHVALGVLAFMVIQVAIMHAFVLENHTLRPSYAAWIALLAGGSVRDFYDALSKAVAFNEGYVPPNPLAAGEPRSLQSTTALEVLLNQQLAGQPPRRASSTECDANGAQDRSPADGDALRKEWVEKMRAARYGRDRIKVPCSHYHRNCEANALQVFRNSYRHSFKMYLPLYVVPAIAGQVLSGKPTGLVARVRSLVLTPLLRTARSALFLGVYAMTLVYCVCFYRRFSPYDKRWHSLLAGLSCGTSILVETPQRHAELNLYCLPRAMEAVFNSLMEHVAKRSVRFSDAPLLDMGLFSAACAVLFWALQQRPQLVRKSFRGILLRLVDNN